MLAKCLICLDYNRIGVSGATAIGPSLAQLSQLKRLRLANNHIDYSAAISIVAGLVELKQLKLLDLSDNQLVTTGVIHELGIPKSVEVLVQREYQD